MRLAFLGTPAAAVPALRALVDEGHDVAIVITRPDRRRGRGNDVVASPVKSAAIELGLPVAYAVKELANVDVEMGVVVAYGAMVPSSILSRIPMLNVHFSLLPRWRGAAPVERAILAGDEETGVSIMSLEETLDTGPVHLMVRVAIGDSSAAELTNRLADVGAAALIEVLSSPELLAHPIAQVGEATYAEKLVKESFRLLPTMTSEEFLRTVRLGRAYCLVDNRRLRIDDASSSDEQGIDPGVVVQRGGHVVAGCRGGAVSVNRVRPEGSRSMAALEWIVGTRWSTGSAQWS